jgi:hypothetical protein
MIGKENDDLSSSVQVVHSQHGREDGSLVDGRVHELKVENQRLQLLVAELLIKNQKLRKMVRNVES